MTTSASKSLRLKFHGRIIDNLGIQMYQSPVAAIAELIANAWDADSEKVEIELPGSLFGNAEIIVKDDGLGMEFEACQDRYLNVGYNCRGDNPDKRTRNKSRPMLGRKGIGKFAGFGIAEVVRVETVSKDTGERTVFDLDLKKLLSDEYVSTEGQTITVVEYNSPDAIRKDKHGTKVTLSRLKMAQAPSAVRFAQSMARRFLLHQGQADFSILVNGSPLPDSFNLAGVEYIFPRDYRSGEKPESIIEISPDGWGTEKLDNGKSIQWRFMFYRDTIDEEELRGIAVFAKGKMAQTPFLFNLTGGLGGQHGIEYLPGQVRADYIDTLNNDLIATERQRINWTHEETHPLEEWGQQRLKELLRIWQELRSEERVRGIELKVAGFAERLAKLQTYEARTVKKALNKLAQVATLSKKQFQELGGAVLTAWEQGRLRELIASISEEAEILSETQLLKAYIQP
jgi:Histidine kinase-, DNA gyrase B-, and HSP90-like ATPase